MKLKSKAFLLLYFSHAFILPEFSVLFFILLINYQFININNININNNNIIIIIIIIIYSFWSTGVTVRVCNKFNDL